MWAQWIWGKSEQPNYDNKRTPDEDKNSHNNDAVCLRDSTGIEFVDSNYFINDELLSIDPNSYSDVVLRSLKRFVSPANNTLMARCTSVEMSHILSDSDCHVPHQIMLQKILQEIRNRPVRKRFRGGVNWDTINQQNFDRYFAPGDPRVTIIRKDLNMLHHNDYFLEVSHNSFSNGSLGYSGQPDLTGGGPYSNNPNLPLDEVSYDTEEYLSQLLSFHKTSFFPPVPVKRSVSHGLPCWALQSLRQFLRYRSAKPEDRSQLEVLYSEWFPLMYDDEYFDCVTTLMEKKNENPDDDVTTKQIIRHQHYQRESMSTIVAYIPAGMYTVNIEDNEMAQHFKNDYGDIFHKKTRLKKPDLIWSYSKCHDLVDFDTVTTNIDFMERGSVWNGHKNIKTIQLKNDLVIGHVTGHTLLKHDFFGYEPVYSYMRKRILKKTRNHLMRNVKEENFPNQEAFLQYNSEIASYQQSKIDNLMQSSAYILALGVSDAFSGWGIGQALIAKCEKELKGLNNDLNHIYLHVVAHNTSGIRFYNKLGFKTIFSDPRYYVLAECSFTAEVLIKVIKRKKQIVEISFEGSDMVVKGSGVFLQSSWIIYSERQANDRNCGVHLINHLLQKPEVNQGYLNKISDKLDRFEAMLQGYNPTSRASENADHDGFFNIQVLEGLLMKEHGISFVPFLKFSSQEKNNPTFYYPAFVLNENLHWYCYRRIKGVWFELNSLREFRYFTNQEIDKMLREKVKRGANIFGLISLGESGDELPTADRWCTDLTLEKKRLNDNCFLNKIEKIEDKYISEKKIINIKHENSNQEKRVQHSTHDSNNEVLSNIKDPIDICIVINGKRYHTKIDGAATIANSIQRLKSTISESTHWTSISKVQPKATLIIKNKDTIHDDDGNIVNDQVTNTFFEPKVLYRAN